MGSKRIAEAYATICREVRQRAHADSRARRESLRARELLTRVSDADRPRPRTPCRLRSAPVLSPDPIAADARAIRRVGDVEIGFALRTIGSHDGAPLLTLWLRNAGTESVGFDLARLHVRGHSGKGTRALQLDDPRGEIEPLHIDPGASGREKLRLTDVGHDGGSLTRVCVDVSPAFFESRASLAPVCFVPTDDATWAVAP